MKRKTAQILLVCLVIGWLLVAFVSLRFNKTASFFMLGSSFWLVMFGSLVILVLIGYLIAVLKQLAKVRRRAEVIARGQELGPVIQAPEQLFYRLNKALNQIQTRQRHQQRTVTNITDELVSVLTHLPVGVMVINEQQQVILTNDALAMMLNRPIKSAAHRFTDDIESAALLTMINFAFSHHQDSHQEVTDFQRASTWDVQVINITMEGPSVIVIMYDITELVAAKQSQIDFLRNAGHELKTPIATINGFAETLLNGAKNDPEVLADFLTEIQVAGKQLTELVNDILAISHAQMGETEPLQPVNVTELVKQEIARKLPWANQQGVTIDADLQPALTVSGNGQALTRIVSNLISNAIKYNRVAGSVTVQLAATENNWSLTVIDTGIGISETEQQRVFERFYRVDQSHSKQIEGTGLGLAIVAELVTAYQGHIDLTSRLGQGTKVKLTFPLL